ELINKITPVIVIYSFIMCSGLFIFSPLVIDVFYGSEFKESILVLRILCLIPMCSALINMLGIQTMINLNLEKQFSAILLIGSIIGLIISLVLIRYFDFLGASWAWVISEGTTVCILWIYLKSKGIQVFYFSHMKPTVILKSMTPL